MVNIVRYIAGLLGIGAGHAAKPLVYGDGGESLCEVREAYLDYERGLESDLRRRLSYWESLPGSGIKLAYLVDYRGMKSGVVATRKEWDDRYLVWRYKNNSPKTTPAMHEATVEFVVSKFCKILEGTFGDDVKRLTLVCIPASNPEADRNRSELFSRRMCERSGMENAYGHIGFVEEKVSAKDGGMRMNGDLLDRCYSFDEDFFRGKYVVLCDDVVSTGLSLRTFRDRLESYGATVICAVSVGRTMREHEVVGKKTDESRERTLSVSL